MNNAALILQATDNMKSVEFGEFFIRSNTSETNIGNVIRISLLSNRPKAFE